MPIIQWILAAALTAFFLPSMGWADSCALEVINPQSARAEFFMANIHGNMRFPQMSAGMRLAALNHYLKNPRPLEQILKNATRAEINQLADQMNRVHQAFAIDAATRGFPAPRPAYRVTKVRLKGVIDGGTYGFLLALVNTLHFCFPNGPFKNHVRFFAGGGFPAEQYDAVIKKIDKLMLNERDSERMRVVQRLAAVMEEFENSTEYQTISNQYRAGLRYNAAIKRGESPEKPAEVFDEHVAGEKLWAALKPRVQHEFPNVTTASFHRWASYGLTMTLRGSKPPQE